MLAPPASTSPLPSRSDLSIRTNHGSSNAPFEPSFCAQLTRFFREINPYIIFQGLPLHVQIDTFEETKDTGPVHRGYCQVKVFCDKVGVSYILCNISYIQMSEQDLGFNHGTDVDQPWANVRQTNHLSWQSLVM